MVVDNYAIITITNCRLSLVTFDRRYELCDRTAWHACLLTQSRSQGSRHSHDTSRLLGQIRWLTFSLSAKLEAAILSGTNMNNGHNLLTTSVPVMTTKSQREIVLFLLGSGLDRSGVNITQWSRTMCRRKGRTNAAKMIDLAWRRC